MSLLYVNDSGATIGIEGNCCTVKQKDGSKRMLPIESLDGITIMGQSQMTTQWAQRRGQEKLDEHYNYGAISDDDTVCRRMYAERNSCKLRFQRR